MRQTGQAPSAPFAANGSTSRIVAHSAADAESSRFELWQAGAEMIKAHPFLGIGSRSFLALADLRTRQ